jgi:hypothetical protein
MNLQTIYLFIFIFSLLFNLRIGFKFIISIFQNPPVKINFNKYELIFIGLSLSYIITYLISK